MNPEVLPPAARHPPTRVPRVARHWLTEGEIAAFVILHAPLAAALKVVPLASTGLALGVLLLGLLAAGRDRGPLRVVMAIAYLGGSEVLLRGTRAAVFWEYGKYASMLLAVVVLLRWRPQLRHLDSTGLVYAGLMLPSLLVLPYFDRGDVAFNISGPVCLGVLVWVLSGVALEPRQLRSVLAVMLAPIVGLGFLAAVSTIQVQDFSEVMIGGKATTAGIGPNQVSAILGLGALLAVLLFPMVKKRSNRLLMAGTAVWLLAQAMLSLSRGGFWAGLIAIAAAALVLLRDRRLRRMVLAGALVLVPLFHWVVFPAIDRYTGGLVGARFSDDRLTGRDKIVQADLEMFTDNMLTGVGPGQSKYGHSSTFRAASAHTEYSRLLAEHGTFGLIAMVLLVAMGISRLRRPRHPFERALALSFGLWTAMTMGHSAMRVVAPATIFALAACPWVLPGDAIPQRRRGGLRAPGVAPVGSTPGPQTV